MNEHIAKLKTPDECVTFAKNASRLGRHDLVKAAKRKELQLKAKIYGATTEAEIEAIAAVYAYEEVLSKKNGKPTKASRTWPMIERHGIIAAVERAVDRKDVTMGYKALEEIGLEEFAFEAVILRHPELFSKEAVMISKSRLRNQ